MQHPKPITYKDKAYLKWLKGQPCVVCNQPGENHHVRRSYWGAGTGKKPHSYVCVNLCREHHTLEHSQPFLESDYDVELIIIDNLMRYCHERKQK